MFFGASNKMPKSSSSDKLQVFQPLAISGFVDVTFFGQQVIKIPSLPAQYFTGLPASCYVFAGNRILSLPA